MSDLRQAVDDYLAMRRALGSSLVREGRWLMNFAGYLEQAGSAHVTTELAVTWATRTRADVNPAHWNHRLAVVRAFARHLSTLDPATEIPPAELMPYRYRRVAPYLFTPEQIDALIQAAAGLTHPLRALNHTTLIALLAVTGMRAGEACGLDRSDVDTGTGVVTIRAGKLAKAREVPLHPTAIQALLAYPPATRPAVSCGADAGVLRQRPRQPAGLPPGPRNLRPAVPDRRNRRRSRWPQSPRPRPPP